MITPAAAHVASSPPCTASTRRHGGAVIVLAVAISGALASAAAGACSRDRDTPSAPPAHAARLPLFPPPARVTLAVVGADTLPGDSARTILERDLDFGDQILIASDTPSASAVLHVRATPDGYDVAVARPGGAVLMERAFAVKHVPPARDSAIADSLARDLATHALARDSALTAITALRDSLARERSRRKPFFWTRGQRRAWERTAAARDSIHRVASRTITELHAAARADTVAHRAALARLVASDAARRDSLAKVWRWSIHGIADEVVEWITGTRGYAQSRVAYVVGGRVRVADADGANDHAVTPPGHAMSPSWRHDGRAIVYADLTDTGTRIAWVDLATRRVTVLPGARAGLNITPVYAPDDSTIIFASAGDGGRIRLVAAPADGTAPPRPVGRASAWDNEAPTLSPDGSRVAFMSSRPRTPQIYSMRLDGGDERLETPLPPRGRSYRAAPDWSPDGSAIAFEQQNGNFQIWIVTVADRRMRKLTATAENEDPSWAPDSRHLAMTSTRAGSKAIWVLDTVTGRHRQLTFVSGARLAAWSPRLPTPD